MHARTHTHTNLPANLILPIYDVLALSLLDTFYSIYPLYGLTWSGPVVTLARMDQTGQDIRLLDRYVYISLPVGRTILIDDLGQPMLVTALR